MQSLIRRRLEQKKEKKKSSLFLSSGFRIIIIIINERLLSNIYSFFLSSFRSFSRSRSNFIFDKYNNIIAHYLARSTDKCFLSLAADD